MVLAAALCLIAIYFAPLWHFDFEAPQYPEGLGMSIYATKLGGRVDLINGLNHYIGMAALRKEDFPEFVVFPIAFGIFIITASGVAVLGRLRLLQIWLGVFLLFGLLAVIDFYRWLYNYGHELDPSAPITMDPFTPPILGEKIIANFVVTAWPGLATYFIIVAVFLVAAAIFKEHRRPKRKRK